jgi:hypothetical protein
LDNADSTASFDNGFRLNMGFSGVQGSVQGSRFGSGSWFGSGFLVLFSIVAGSRRR